MFRKNSLKGFLPRRYAQGEYARPVLSKAGFYFGGYVESALERPAMIGCANKAAPDANRAALCYVSGRCCIFQQVVQKVSRGLVIERQGEAGTPAGSICIQFGHGTFERLCTKIFLDIKNGVYGIGQKLNNFRIPIGLRQESLAAFDPACNDTAGLPGAESLVQNGVEEMSYRAPVFGKQLLWKPGLAGNGSEVAIALVVFGKSPECQSSADKLFQLLCGVSKR